MKATKAKSQRKTKIIVVINQKGGAGKTTVSFHLAHAASQKGEDARVLCLDMDSQGNFSQYLTSDLDIVSRTSGGVGDLLDGAPLVPEQTTEERIDLLHGHMELDRYDFDDEAENRAYSPELPVQLRNLGYDYIVIDTPPAVGLRHLAPLAWADIAVIPLEPAVSGITGFQNVLNAIEKSIKALNPGLKWVGVMNRANMRVSTHREKDQFMRATYGKSILATLSTRTAVADAMEQSPARPVWKLRAAPRELRQQWLDFCNAVIDK